MKYEAHITVEPAEETNGVSFEQFAQDVSEVGWKASKFEHDDVDGIAGKWFMSYASDDRNDMVTSTQAMIEAAERRFTVLRWKVERTMYDSKEGAQPNQMRRGLPGLARGDKPLAGLPIGEVGDIAVEELENLGLTEPCIVLIVVHPTSEEVALTTNVGDPSFPVQVATYILEQHGIGVRSAAGDTVQ